MGAVAIELGKATRFRQALKIDRLLTEFAGLLADLGANDLVADVAAMRAKNALRMTDQDQRAAYDEMCSQ